MNLTKKIIGSLTAFILTGCATTPSQTGRAAAQQRPLEVASPLKFEDVPVPSGFVIQRESSFAFQNDYVRVGILRYTGPTDEDRLALFYKEQMPMYNWSIINIVEYGRKIMNFAKEAQTCTITIDKAGANKASLIISVAPIVENSKKILDK